MYYGDEIGMTNVVIPAAEVQDPAEKNEPGKGMGRDPERTPMQWDSSPHGRVYGRTFRGFGWLPIMRRSTWPRSRVRVIRFSACIARSSICATFECGFEYRRR